MQRFRRLRRDERIRSIMQETRLHPKDFIYPIFVIEGEDIKNPVASMPGIFQYSIDRLEEILEQVKEAGIGGIMLFGLPFIKTRKAVRRMLRTELRSRQSASLRRNILRYTLLWIFAYANTLPMGIAVWCVEKKF